MLALCAATAQESSTGLTPVAVMGIGRTAAPRSTLAKTNPAAAQAIERGLTWLRDHQDEDGRWNSEGFMRHDKGQPSDGAGNPVHDLGNVGLAMLALGREGVAAKDDPNRQAMLKAAHWLKDQQNKDGLLGQKASQSFIYGHAIGTLGLCAVAAATDSAEARDTAKLALGYLEHHRNPFGVWRYMPRDGDNDTSVTTWCVLAEVAALELGLQIDGKALKSATVWFDAVTDQTGQAGYMKRGDGSSRPVGKMKQFPPAKGEAMTAAGLLCRQALGQQQGDWPVLAAAADRLLAKPPAWDPKSGAVDECYWFFASEALRHFGGKQRAQWNEKLVTSLLEGQRKDDAAAGSWDPVGPWGEDGGRIYATALAVLSLQSLYPLPAK
jgi:hypothetical protein